MSDAQVKLHWGVKIRLRDGVHLNATLYLPNGERGPGPAIFALTPYIGQTYHDRGLYFALQGYPFLTIDVRGRGNSEGTFQPLVNEADDAFDVVEWLARQPYCNGRVAMWGGSYSGYTQWAAAKEHPPHLATIVPVAAPCAGVDFPGRSNILAPYLMQWLTLVWGRTSQDKLFWGQERYWAEKFRQWFESGAPFRTLDSQLGCPSPVFQEWLAHPAQDEYWERCNPTASQYANISIPVLTITGIYDGDQAGALAHYRAHRRHNPSAPHYLVIGPWDHAGTRTPQAQFCGITCGPESLVDFGQLHLEWYAWAMQGGPKPQFLERAVAYYVMSADKWRYADSLEAITAQSIPFYLHSGVLAKDSPRRGDPDVYRYDPHDLSLAPLESTVDPQDCTDQRVFHASVGKVLVYHTEPFEEDVEISGFFRLSVWLSIDQPDTDFRAIVYEVQLDGSAVRLTDDSMRARYRESLRQPKLIDSSTPLHYLFERFTFTSTRVKKGSRLRLVFGPINSIYSERNYNSGRVVAEECMDDARAVTVQLFHDREYPSILHIPFARQDG